MSMQGKPHLYQSGGNWHCRAGSGVIAVSQSMRVAYAGWRQVNNTAREVERIISMPNPLKLP